MGTQALVIDLLALDYLHEVEAGHGGGQVFLDECLHEIRSVCCWLASHRFGNKREGVNDLGKWLEGQQRIRFVLTVEQPDEEVDAD